MPSTDKVNLLLCRVMTKPFECWKVVLLVIMFASVMKTWYWCTGTAQALQALELHN